MNKEENDMGRILFIGFKGTKNSSGLLVRSLSPRHCLLTNSFEGLRKDIEKLPVDCDRVYLFGADKNLRDSFRLERMAEKDGIRLTSALDPEKLADQFASSGILTGISETPTRYPNLHCLRIYVGQTPYDELRLDQRKNARSPPCLPPWGKVDFAQIACNLSKRRMRS